MPGPVIKTPQLPGWADPETASVFDPLHETLIKKAVGALGINDPMTALTAPMAPMMAAGKLEPFLIQMYKQRLKADPSLAYHTGLHQVPEFQEAFKVLYPNKTFTTKTPTKSLSKRLQEVPVPPAIKVTEGGDPIEAAMTYTTAVPTPKPPRTMTIKEFRVSKGIPPQGRPEHPRPSKYSAELRQNIVDRVAAGASAKDVAVELGMPKQTVHDLLRQAGMKPGHRSR